MARFPPSNRQSGPHELPVTITLGTATHSQTLIMLALILITLAALFWMPPMAVSTIIALEQIDFAATLTATLEVVLPIITNLIPVMIWTIVSYTYVRYIVLDTQITIESNGSQIPRTLFSAFHLSAPFYIDLNADTVFILDYTIILDGQHTSIYTWNAAWDGILFDGLAFANFSEDAVVVCPVVAAVEVAPIREMVIAVEMPLLKRTPVEMDLPRSLTHRTRRVRKTLTFTERVDALRPVQKKFGNFKIASPHAFPVSSESSSEPPKDMKASDKLARSQSVRLVMKQSICSWNAQKTALAEAAYILVLFSRGPSAPISATSTPLP